jgi:ubiquitin carboxyl-terminal hydrolase 5/13
LASVTELGFSRNAAIRALSKNQNNVEVACGWLYEHLDDADLNDPVQPKTKTKQTGPPKDLIDQVTSMGFSDQQAIVTLMKYVRLHLTQNNNV